MPSCSRGTVRVSAPEIFHHGWFVQAVRSRSRQAALPLLVLPLVSPVIIAATKATATLAQGSDILAPAFVR